MAHGKDSTATTLFVILVLGGGAMWRSIDPFLRALGEAL